jgi:hypothetical protein
MLLGQPHLGLFKSYRNHEHLSVSFTVVLQVNTVTLCLLKFICNFSELIAYYWH